MVKPQELVYGALSAHPLIADAEETQLDDGSGYSVLTVTTTDGKQFTVNVDSEFLEELDGEEA
jgi:hypothetical protein